MSNLFSYKFCSFLQQQQSLFPMQKINSVRILWMRVCFYEMGLAFHFYSPLFSVLFVSTLNKLEIYTSCWYLQHVTRSLPIWACPFLARLFIFFRICLLLKFLKSKMNLQDLCRMQNIFCYRQKILLGLIV